MSKQDYYLKFKWALLPLLCVACGYTLAAADQRIVEWEYHPNTVYSLFIPVGSHIHIALEEGEKFLNLGSGNTSAIDVGAEGSQLVIKAHDSVTHSNLTLITDRRVYIFDYTASVPKAAGNPKTPEPARLYSIHFRYPTLSTRPADTPTKSHHASADLTTSPSPNADASESTSSRRSEPTSISVPPARNLDYWYKGPPLFKPIEVSDNGLQTKILFAPQTPLPAIYVIEDDGSESLTNLHVQDDHLVLHRVAAHWLLKRGQSIAFIDNRSFNRIGSRANSGTVDPTVERVLREITP